MTNTIGKIFSITSFGSSHGRALGAVVDGCPANLELSEEDIQIELDKRRPGTSALTTSRKEGDKIEILSGIFEGKTTGTPISLVIENTSQISKDYSDLEAVYRPGHADYAGSVKYNQKDLRNILERSSARKTAIEVAVGAVAKLLLKELEITGSSKVIQIGSACCTAEFKEEIDIMRGKGDTVGGKFVVQYKNLPIGLGSFVHWDRKIDGRLAQAIMSIPAVKTVEIGTNPLGYQGSQYHDELVIKDGEISHKTNHAGGIEGGMTNGEDLIISGVMKPIPTMRTPLKTVDCCSMKETEAHFERSDVCAVEACSVVAEARVAWILADEILLKYGGDCMDELKRHFKGS
jgi:chorismate synthase